MTTLIVGVIAIVVGLAVGVWLWAMRDAYKKSGRGKNPNLKD